jgi:hypothetical protein
MIAAIPSVDPGELGKAYEILRTSPNNNPVSRGVFRAVCKPDTDMASLARRLQFLHWLAVWPLNEELRTVLTPWLSPEKAWTDSAFRVASKLSMDWNDDSLHASKEEIEEFIAELKKEGWE